MPNPAIAAITDGYQVTNTTALVADLKLRLDLADQTIAINCPDLDLAHIHVVLVDVASGVEHDVGLSDTYTTPVPWTGRNVSSTSAGAVLDITISAVGAPTVVAPGEEWRVRLEDTHLPKQARTFAVTVTPHPGVTWLVCDPPTTPTPAGPITVYEQDTPPILLTAPAISTSVQGTVPGGVVASYQWGYTGDIAITDFNLATSQSVSFTPPGVYAETPIGVTVKVTLANAAWPAGFLAATTAPPVAIKIEPRPKFTMIVLDRSGSMSVENRWVNAVKAGQLLVYLNYVLRKDTGTADQVGVMFFEDHVCDWHVGVDGPSFIGDVLALETVTQAFQNSCAAVYGNAGTCTPIGDSLYVAMNKLAAIGAVANARYTIVLLTDGYENSGAYHVGPYQPWMVGQGNYHPTEFQAQRTNEAGRARVNAALTIWGVGLGQLPDHDVMQQLTVSPTLVGGGGQYQAVLDVATLQEALMEALGRAHEAQAMAPEAGPYSLDSGNPGANLAWYVKVEQKARVLALAVDGVGPSDDVRLWYRTWNGTTFPDNFAAWTPAVDQYCNGFRFLAVQLADLPSGLPVPSTEWRIEVFTNDQPTLLTNMKVLLWVDLFLKVEIRFDEARYRTGQTMNITGLVRAGSTPIAGATFVAELARPGESLGTFLVQNSQGYVPAKQRGPDPNAPKPAMMTALFQKKDFGGGLPFVMPTSIFDDGSNELLDKGGGVYSNTYSKTDMEGPYTWRFHVTGQTPDGAPFDRLITQTHFVGVAIDAAFTNVKLTYGVSAPPGFQAATITVVPQGVGGIYLGPFHEDKVLFDTSVGTWLEPMTQGAFDGSYSRTVLYKKGETPVVTVSYEGACSEPIVVAPGCLGQLIVLASRLLKWLLRLARRA